jgi:hypothetical protein
MTDDDAYDHDMMSMGQLVEWELARETEVLGENLPQRRFVHKSHII